MLHQMHYVWLMIRLFMVGSFNRTQKEGGVRIAESVQWQDYRLDDTKFKSSQ